jgi:hypothetical protein
MAIRALVSDCTALILAFASFTLAFFLLVDLGFMVPYFASGGGGSGWSGHVWRKFLNDVIQPGPMAALGGWAAVTAGTGLLGKLLGAPDRKTKAAITLSSLAFLLSNCGMIGAGIAVSILASLVACRIVWFW